MITIIGLGPGDPQLLTRQAWEALSLLSRLYLRTTIHPTVAALPATLDIITFDSLYEQVPRFEIIYETIAAELVKRAQAGEAVTYAVPGHPLVAEATTQHVLAHARAAGIPVTVVAGLSFVEPVCTALGLDPFAQGLQLLDALDLLPPAAPQGTPAWSEIQGLGAYQPPLTPFPLVASRPALLCQLYNRRIAADVKLSLLERYPAEHPVTIVQAAGVAGRERIWTIPLHQIDHDYPLDHLTCAYLPALDPLSDLRSPDGPVAVVTRLLGRDGCPWDREQTHRSLRGGLLEETHEVLEAIDAEDDAALTEELGDLLLHILLHSEMARQAGTFDFADVCEGIASKLIRRHPHVFGNLHVGDSGEVLTNWESIKARERAEQGRERRGTLDGIPPGLPALSTAQEVGRKAGKAGFDWPQIDSLWIKLHEELTELHAEAHATQPPDLVRVEDELGDVLYVAANLGRRLGVDAESALRGAVAKFRRRFTVVEELAAGRDLRTLSLAQLEDLWQQAKRNT